jgi:hypothetical protein
MSEIIFRQNRAAYLPGPAPPAAFSDWLAG